MSNKKIVFIGDSITEGFNTKKFLPAYNIINKGVSGENCSDVYRRLDSDVINQKPDAVFLLIGTNDFAQGNTNEAIAGGITDILQKLINNLNGRNIFLTTILPVRDAVNRPNERIKSLNHQLAKISASLNVKLFDLHDALKDEEGKLEKEFTDDGLHLTEAAYLKWAESFSEVFKE